ARPGLMLRMPGPMLSSPPPFGDAASRAALAFSDGPPVMVATACSRGDLAPSTGLPCASVGGVTNRLHQGSGAGAATAVPLEGAVAPPNFAESSPIVAFVSSAPYCAISFFCVGAPKRESGISCATCACTSVVALIALGNFVVSIPALAANCSQVGVSIWKKP